MGPGDRRLGSGLVRQRRAVLLRPAVLRTPSFPPIGSNFGFYNSATTNSLVTQASEATSESQATQLWAQADQQVMKDAAFFPITSPLQPNYHAKQVHNAIYIPEIQNFDPTNVWLSSGVQGG